MNYLKQYVKYKWVFEYYLIFKKLYKDSIHFDKLTIIYCDVN